MWFIWTEKWKFRSLKLGVSKKNKKPIKSRKPEKKTEKPNYEKKPITIFKKPTILVL
jgi:hypothetical protein